MLHAALLFERATLNKIAHIVSTLGAHQPSSATWCNLPLPKSFEEGSGENYIAKINGQSVLLGGTTASGEWVDVVVFENWLKWAIQTQVFNLMKRSAKPSSIQIENSIRTALEAGKSLGGLSSFTVRTTNVDRQNRTASYEWEAQLTGAIHSTTITGIVTP